MKAKLSSYATVTDYNRRFVEYAESIDFTDLFDHVKAFAKVNCEFEKPEIFTGRDGSTYIKFQSSDIADQCGPFGVILECCRIMNFSGCVVLEDDDTFRYWVGVSLRYSHKDGGSNGMDICRAEYRNGKWSFGNAGERR
jgi:hypothetical protein